MYTSPKPYDHVPCIADISVIRRTYLITAAVSTITFSLLRLLIELCQVLRLGEIEQLFTRKVGNGGARVHGRMRLCPMFKFVAISCIEWKYFTRLINYLEIPM